ncbi:MAG: helix-turn-helix domain-containing protein [Lachnospiraceae bacterium]|nr:helix-turn-helix domain-containing protein [Lachnospiraceae bacterium]
MMALYKEAGERILLARVMRGYTRECLAELASISPKFLYEIETGRKGFSAIVLYNLCNALKVNSDYILTGTEKVEYDHKLVEILQLFNQSQTERLSVILKQIYELL